MNEHIQHLHNHIPSFNSLNVLDLGAGKGGFLIACTKQNIEAVGLEMNSAYIMHAQQQAKENGISIEIVQGVAEGIPFDDDSFDFINCAEVIEHVQDPELMVQEMSRVVRSGGWAYVSVPNRFSFRDPHFYLYGVNWLPRKWSSAFISFFGRHKDYGGEAGFQRLTEMHYFTFSQAVDLFERYDFSVTDIREKRLREMTRSHFLRFILLCVYIPARCVYFDTFHLLLEKR